MTGRRDRQPSLSGPQTGRHKRVESQTPPAGSANFKSPCKVDDPVIDFYAMHDYLLAQVKSMDGENRHRVKLGDSKRQDYKTPAEVRSIPSDYKTRLLQPSERQKLNVVLQTFRIIRNGPVSKDASPETSTAVTYRLMPLVVSDIGTAIIRRKPLNPGARELTATKPR